MKRRLTSLLLLLFLMPLTADEEETDAAGAMERLIPKFRDVRQVVWLVDRSGSMKETLRGIGDEVARLKKILGAADNYYVKMSVIAFDNRIRIEQKPTESTRKVADALKGIKSYGRARENVFLAVSKAVQEYKDEPEGSLMFVLVTDECGDDADKLEDTIDACRDRKIPVVVLGRQAAFGRARWEWQEVGFDPAGGKKTVVIKKARLGSEGPFNTLIYDHLLIQKLSDPLGRGIAWAMPSGFSGWALSRLGRETGGVFIPLKSMSTHLPLKCPFEAKQKVDYRPDLSSKKDIVARTKKKPIRMAVVDGYMAYRKLPSLTREFRSVGDSKQLAALLKKESAKLEQRIPLIEEIIGSMLEARPHYMEDSLRWRADWELGIACLAVASYHQVLLKSMYTDVIADPGLVTLTKKNGFVLILPKSAPDGFSTNTLLGSMKPAEDEGEDDPDFFGDEDEGVSENRQIKKLDIKELQTLKSSDAAKRRERAEFALELVRHNHPGTPWAVMAEHLQKHLGEYEIYAEPKLPPSNGSDGIDINEAGQ